MKHLRTRCARGIVDGTNVGRPLAPVIVAASTFEFDDQAAVDRYYDAGEGWVYSREGNPTVRGTERFLATLEEAEDAAAFGSGMAAISTVFLALARTGDRVAAQRELYGGSLELLAHLMADLGIEVVWLDREELTALDPGRIAGCRVLYLETPTNPALRLVDLRRAADAANEAGVTVVVDGTFATPALQRPLTLGADLVVHSVTKYLGGHSDLIGGAVAGSSALVRRIAKRRKALGGTMDPFTAFLLQRGMRTLAVRMEAHGRNAARVAEFLRAHPGVERTHYPGLVDHPDHDLARTQMDGYGGMVSFVVPGGLAAATRVHDRLELFARAASLGGVESSVSIPARMSHRGLDPAARAAAGVSDGMLRLSVGLEAAEDLVEDLERALDQ